MEGREFGPDGYVFESLEEEIAHINSGHLSKPNKTKLIKKARTKWLGETPTPPRATGAPPGLRTTEGNVQAAHEGADVPDEDEEVSEREG